MKRKRISIPRTMPAEVTAAAMSMVRNEYV